MSRIALSIFCLLLISICVPGAEAQEGEVAVLDRGPVYKKGLPFFLPNAIPSFRADYAFRGIEITVFYTDAAIVRKAEWAGFPCTETDGLVVRENSDFLLLVPAEESEWTLFFLFPDMRDDICLFIDTFMARFRYFRGITRDRSIPPFPAVISFN